MKNVIVIIGLLMSLLSFGQSETPSSKKIAAEFEKYYNSDEYQQLFNLFSADMKAYLPIEKTTDFIKNLKIQAGKIKQRTFLNYANGVYAVYKTTFERGIFELNISLNAQNEINGLFIKPYQEENLPKLERNQSKLILPFKEEWTVFWGGDTKEQNYHVDFKAQKNAFDMVILNKNGQSYKTNGATNEDYYAFGKELISPCDAEVVLVVDGIKDNKPKVVNPMYVPGNTVILKTMNDEYLFFAHFKQHSIVVKEGQIVKQGELLGLCGNSGNSSEPHLHFHIQSIEDINKATGVKCYFENIFVNGTLQHEYSPVKGDKIKRK